MANIEWTPPPPRHSILGAWDKFVGPGATAAEEWLQLVGGVALTAMLGVLLYLRRDTLDWSPLQIALVALFAFDLIGGVITNATSAAKRWYHRAGHDTLRAHLQFVAIHGLHLFVVAAAFREMDWAYFTIHYVYLLLATIIISRTPLHVQRPVSMALYCGALLLAFYAFAPVVGLEWFLPLFYLKLLVSHLVKEAPFTPA